MDERQLFVRREGPAPVHPDVSLLHYILEALRKNSSRSNPAQVSAHDGSALSFSEVLRQAVQAAEGWRSMGLGLGDTVVLLANNYHQIYAAVLGAMFAGCTVASCIPSSSEVELRDMLSLCGARAVLCEADTLQTALRAVPSCQHVVFGDDAARAATDGVKTLESLLQDGAAADPATFKPAVIPDPRNHVTYIAFTSGSTGRPKGVMITDYAQLARLLHAEGPFSSRAGDWVLATHGLCYHIALTMFLQCLSSGATRVFVTRGHASESETVRFLEKFKINSWLAEPFMVYALRGVLLTGSFNLSHLQAVHCAGFPLPADLQTALTDLLGVPILQNYGLTEACRVFVDRKPATPGSMGLLQPGVQLRLVDEQTGVDLREDGQIGELRIKTPSLMKGYVSSPEETANCFDAHGFFRTGDLVRRAPDGRYWFVSRIKEMIRNTVLDVAPAELEAVLLAHPGVKEAAVVGRRMPDLYEVPAAFVVLQDKTVTETALTNLIKSKLPETKWLHGGLFILDSLPRTSSGKIGRAELKKRLNDKPNVD